jgi:hypothetical protein
MAMNNKSAKKKGSGINSDAFVAGFKYGKGEITKAEAKTLIAKSKFKGLSAKEKATYAFSARNEKPMVRAKVSARKGTSAAKQENAMIQRGKKK